MKFKEIIKRITGISTPIFGVSWNPDHTERDIARQVIVFLEDRRVLYVPCEMECPDHCVQSVLQMREFLTARIAETPEKTELSNSLRAMRAACRKFLGAVGDPHGEVVRFGFQSGHYASWKFLSAIGELRGIFGVQVAKIAVAYGIDVEKELASILPEEDRD
ncbi:MAG: DUF6650 family protein [Candidatus Bathyarchaeia archaeon]|jgi:hypothetical protein